MKNIISRLLRRNVSPVQTVGYALANLVGLAIMLLAIQFYRDITSMASADDSFISSDYLIISKKVDTPMGVTPFSPEEQQEIASQPWAAATGAFTAADFNVSLSLAMGGSNMYTSLFLEAIPDEFFDVSPRGWDTYEPGSGETLPVIISKDYLTLYNFGYASARGLPQISEDMISMLPLRLSLSGNGRQEWVDARIAGFSSRLNTIAVPERFMTWANHRFAPGASSLPSRLIVKLRQAADPAALEYLHTHGLEAAGDREAGSKMMRFMGLATAVVVAVGAMICLLAVFILVLSVWLLLQKNRAKIHDLLQLGYAPSQITAVYMRLISAVNIVVYLCAALILWSVAQWWHPAMAQLGTTGSELWFTLLCGLAITVLVTLTGWLAVSSSVRSAFRT
ncbi:MAG: ABC transporter permease [Muribaculaceae bacterium]|nr:ABC transporter permease [Muribaculaceae bacterium]